jgi:hypothetical protein
MANTFKVLSRAAATTSASTVYTVPSATTALINNLVITNTAGSSATYTISLNDVALASGASVPANDAVILDIRQVLSASATIKTFASATTVNFHISGIEIS